MLTTWTDLEAVMLMRAVQKVSGHGTRKLEAFLAGLFPDGPLDSVSREFCVGVPGVGGFLHTTLVLRTGRVIQMTGSRWTGENRILIYAHRAFTWAWKFQRPWGKMRCKWHFGLRRGVGKPQGGEKEWALANSFVQGQPGTNGSQRGIWGTDCCWDPPQLSHLIQGCWGDHPKGKALRPLPEAGFSVRVSGQAQGRLICTPRALSGDTPLRPQQCYNYEILFMSPPKNSFIIACIISCLNHCNSLLPNLPTVRVVLVFFSVYRLDRVIFLNKLDTS